MSKFEEIIGQFENPTHEQIMDAVKQTVNGFTNIEELNDFLIKFSASDAYEIIRDIVHPSRNMIIARAKKNNKEEYQKFQDIMMQSKKVYEYEKKNATIFDVRNISTSIAQQFYSITVRMISVLDDELGKVEKAVNTIEEHNGMSVTNFEKEGANDDTTSNDEQRSKETAREPR